MKLSIVLAVFLSGSSLLAAKRPLTDTDLYSFQWVATPQISPDGTAVAYTHVRVNAKKDGYETSLWVVPFGGGTPRQLTAGPRDSGLQWSPGGRTLAFIRAGEKDGKPQPGQIFLLPMDGGEAQQLTDLPKGAAAITWSPDGRRIAFTSTTTAKDLETKNPKEAEKSDVRVIVRAAYRDNGTGYAEPGRVTHIWTVDVPANPTSIPKAKQITTGSFAESEPVWSKDGTTIHYSSNRELEPYYKPQDADLYAVPSTGGTGKRIASVEGAIRGLSLSPDGKQMAFVAALNGNPIRSYSQADLWVVGLDGASTPRMLTDGFDYDIGGQVGGDQHAPRGAAPSRAFWAGDGTAITVVTSEEGRTNLRRFDAVSGKMTPVTNANQDVEAYSATPDGAKVALVVSSPTNIGDVYAFDGTLRRLTNVNEKLFAAIQLSEPEMIWYKSFDGKKIQAWVQRPPNFDPNKKYPLILNIHGGPHAAYGYTFDHEFQWMAAQGYVVLYPNPRGSTSYGQDFGNIIQYNYPGDDYKDLMAGVDEVIRLGWVDPAKMGVTGGSGGGVLTNWVIGHTDRFAAAVSQRSIADWRDFWYTADFTLFQATWFRGAPWEHEADFKARSPITFIDKIKTPLMLIEGDADLRTPPAAGGEQMFRALKYKKIPTAMIQFPGESHELSRSGNPAHRVERLRHIVAWFDKYVMGMPIKTYDVH